MIIRPLRRDDLPALAALYRELSGEDAHLGAMETTFAAIADNPDYLLLCCDADGLLAASAMGVVCRQLSRDARPFMVMENFVVAQAFRRRGVGLRLLRELEKRAGERNCRAVMFVSSHRRKAAHQFYQAAGYRLDAVQGFKKLL